MVVGSSPTAPTTKAQAEVDGIRGLRRPCPGRRQAPPSGLTDEDGDDTITLAGADTG